MPQHNVEHHCPAVYSRVTVRITILHLRIMYRASLKDIERKHGHTVRIIRCHTEQGHTDQRPLQVLSQIIILDIFGLLISPCDGPSSVSCHVTSSIQQVF